MSMPFYASAEQVMRDRSEYARKGIARGRSVVVLTYVNGVLFVAENASSALHKVSEIYDRIGFAAVGKYNEFENLRVAGIRLADLRGYSYDRRDVTARALANAYAQTLGSIFTAEPKPYEVELCVAQVGDDGSQDQMYRLSYDGTIADEREFLVMGGQAETVATALRGTYHPGLSLEEAVLVAVAALGSAGADGGALRQLSAEQLEVAVLDRTRGARKFKRVDGAALVDILAGGAQAIGGSPAAQNAPADTPPANGGAASADAGPDGTGPEGTGPEGTAPQGTADPAAPGDDQRAPGGNGA